MALSVPDVFAKDKAALLQEISARQSSAISDESRLQVQKTYVINSRGKEQKCDVETLEKILQPLKDRGLRTRYDEDRWYFECGKCTDEGTLLMPLLTAVRCAEKIMEG